MGFLQLLRSPHSKPRLGEIILREGGLLAVISADEVSKAGRNTYAFGDRTWNMALASRLHRADPRKLYQNGLCRVLSEELWCHNPRVVGISVLAAPEDEELGIHEVVELDDGTYADSMGIWSKQGLLKQWRATNPAVRLRRLIPGEGLEPKDPTLAVESGHLFAIMTEVIATA